MFTYLPYIKPLPYYAEPEPAAISERAKVSKVLGKTIVIASGVFDLLHDAHKTYLQKAKEAGDYLIVLVESDVRTKELKGEGRPVWDQGKRKAAIQALGIADDVLILPPEFKNPLRFEELVILLAPDVYAESSNSTALDHKIKLMEKYQGKVEIVLQEIPGVSTSELLKSSIV